MAKGRSDKKEVSGSRRATDGDPPMPSDEAPRPVRSAFLPIDFGPDFAENVKLLQRRMREYNRGADAIEPLELFARNGKLCLAPGTYPEYFFPAHALFPRSRCEEWPQEFPGGSPVQRHVQAASGWPGAHAGVLRGALGGSVARPLAGAAPRRLHHRLARAPQPLLRRAAARLRTALIRSRTS